ncbi:MAG: radical SAM protein [Ruminococcus sp.]|nr:radical SAM protein [Ruminococcus sp.]
MEEYLCEGCFTLQWHITHRCNLRCAHCYQDDYSAFESRDTMTDVLDQFQALLREYRLRGHINVTGGEPLTHPDLFWLLREISDRHISSGVLTNGTLVGLREARLFRACGVDYVQISLDGLEKTHDAIRGEGSYARALKGINALKAQGLFTSVSFTAQRGNLRDLPGLARVCEKAGVDKLWFDRVVIPADEDPKGLSLDKKDFQKLIKTAARLNRSGKVFCGRALQFIPCRRKNIYRCSAGDSLLVLLADGSVMPCRRLPIVAGNAHDSTLLSIYRDSPVMISLRETGVPQGCRGCRYSEDCRGGAKCAAYARFGRYDIPDPDCPLLKY